MSYCHDCGSEGVSTLACKLWGSCKMHDTERLNRERDHAQQRGEKLLVDMTQEERNEKALSFLKGWQ